MTNQFSSDIEYLDQARERDRLKDSFMPTPDHYDLPIQPVDYIVKNSLGFLEGNVIKYVTRHHDKGGVADIQKAIHYLALLLDTEYGVRADVTYYPRLAQRWQAPPVASGEIASNYYRRYANAH